MLAMRPPRYTQGRSSAASDGYKSQSRPSPLSSPHHVPSPFFAVLTTSFKRHVVLLLGQRSKVLRDHRLRSTRTNTRLMRCTKHDWPSSCFSPVRRIWFCSVVRTPAGSHLGSTACSVCCLLFLFLRRLPPMA